VRRHPDVWLLENSQSDKENNEDGQFSSLNSCQLPPGLSQTASGESSQRGSSHYDPGFDPLVSPSEGEDTVSKSQNVTRSWSRVGASHPVPIQIQPWKRSTHALSGCPGILYGGDYVPDRLRPAPSPSLQAFASLSDGFPTGWSRLFKELSQGIARAKQSGSGQPSGRIIVPNVKQD
jgi:hypothetical protein